MVNLVILNQQAGTLAGQVGGERGEGDVFDQALAKSGLVAEVRRVPGAEMEAALLAAAARRPNALIVGGGDGSISTAAGIVADTETVLGVLPLGTLNHFAKDLGMPADLAESLRVIAAGHVRRVDVAEINGRVFINNCSVGAYPAAVRRREMMRELHGHGKWRAMFMASLQVLRRLRRMRVELAIDGARRFARTPFVLVSNNRYAGHLFSRRLRARVDEGKLWVYSTRAHRHGQLLRLALQAFAGRLDQAEDFQSEAAEHVTLVLRDPLPSVAMDGEVMTLPSPLNVRIRPGALRVFAPPPASSS